LVTASCEVKLGSMTVEAGAARVRLLGRDRRVMKEVDFILFVRVDGVVT